MYVSTLEGTRTNGACSVATADGGSTVTLRRVAGTTCGHLRTAVAQSAEALNEDVSVDVAGGLVTVTTRRNTGRRRGRRGGRRRRPGAARPPLSGAHRPGSRRDPHARVPTPPVPTRSRK